MRGAAPLASKSSAAHPACMRYSIIFVALLATSAAAQEPLPQNAQRYVKTNAMVPMRDGVKLNTDIYAPRDQTGSLPVIFLRTPYGIGGGAGALNSSLKELADDGYIFV